MLLVTGDLDGDGQADTVLGEPAASPSGAYTVISRVGGTSGDLIDVYLYDPGARRLQPVPIAFLLQDEKLAAIKPW